MALSPRVKRRLQIFRGLRRGYFSLLALTVLIAVSLAAELLCNQRPLVVRYEGHWYWPVFVSYPETAFGGVFDSEADYHEPTVADALKRDGNWAMFPPVQYDYQYIDTRLSQPAPSPPDGSHWLGTDDRGRDIVARLVYGFRLSVVFGLTLAVFGSLMGIVLGALQGYIGGVFDLISQRVIEVWSAQNELYLLIILSSIFEPSLTLIFVLLSLFGWMGLAAYVRAEFLRARQAEYVQSAIALGGQRWRIILKHVLPNALTPVITFFPFRIADGVMGLTALDFLSLGVPPPTPSLGELLSQGKANLTSWWIIVSVFVVISALILMLNFVGEAVQKAMDPRSVA
ncbi:MAG: ABC transporter permease [Deltaproteobacteria bacterium]|nr:ABC transporter permease [Deltaproteobacteria bacterium]